MRRIPRIRFAALVAGSLLLCAPLPSLGAAEPETEPESKSVPWPVTALAIEDVTDQALNVSQRLRSFTPSPRAGERFAASKATHGRLSEQVHPRLARSRAALASRANIDELRSLRAEFVALAKLLEAGEEVVADRVQDLAGGLRELEHMQARWKATQQAADPTTTPEPILRRIDLTLEAIEDTVGQERIRRDAVLTLRERFVEDQVAVDGALEAIDDEIGSRFEQLFRADREPMWNTEFLAPFLIWWRGGPIRIGATHIVDYVRDQSHTIAFQVFVVLAVSLLFSFLRSRLRARQFQFGDLAEAESTWERPYSMALILAVWTSEFFFPLHPLAPSIYSSFLVGLVLIAPVVRVARQRLESPLRDATLGLVGLFVIDRIYFLMTPIADVARWFLALSLSVALLFFFWLQRACAREPHRPQLQLVRVGARIAIFVILIALLAETAGWSQLGTVLGVGTLRAALRALAVFALLEVAKALVAYMLTSSIASRLNVIRRHRLLVRDRLYWILRAAAMVLWVSLALESYGFGGIGWVLLNAILASGVTVGALSLTLGDVVSFVLTLVVAFYLARTVEFALDEEVYPRLKLPRGVPYALSALTRYSLFVVGFLFALAAAGIELGRLAILAGGLGVGIGFGLQNVTNNFISGLILLFERPVQVGDMVELQSLVGYIRRIGIRATVIETLDGSEVIVPNGHLISDLVTNWTLSYNYRRIEISVGVAYGTNAERVIALLLEAALSCEDVRQDPTPQAFFVGFGESSLDFVVRVWASRYDLAYPVRSQVAVAIQRALEDAGITVPFPQRDLHVKTTSPELQPTPAGRTSNRDPEQGAS